MKKVLCFVLTVGILMSLFCVGAGAAETKAVSGIYALAAEPDHAAAVTLTAKDGAGNAVTATSVTMGGQTVEGFYTAAEQVEVTCTGVEDGVEYLVIVLNDDSAVPTEDNISYIDQTAAADTSIAFAVYPNKLESGKTYRIYLSSDAEAGAIQGLVRIASFRYGTSDTPKEDDGGSTGGGNTGGGNTGGGTTGGGTTGGGGVGGGAAGGDVGGGGGTGLDNAKRFEDMPGHWAEASVNFVSQRNLFQGTSETRFSPNLAMTRSMLVTVLYRLDGEKKTETAAVFEDVAKGIWYTDAVAWGSATGVVKGYTDTSFAPNDNITREQLAAMIYRYAQILGSTAGEASELDFVDAARVSGWAAEGMRWAVGNGIITGKPGNLLDPQGNATRAEVATVFERFVKLLEK